MAKKKAGTTKKKTTEHKKIRMLAFLGSWFVKITSYNFDDATNILTLSAACQFPAGTPNLGAAVIYIDTDNDTTGSGTATLKNTSISASIVLPVDAVCCVQVSLVDTSTTPNTIKASDTLIFDTEFDEIGVQEADTPLAPPPPPPVPPPPVPPPPLPPPPR